VDQRAFCVERPWKCTECGFPDAASGAPYIQEVSAHRFVGDGLRRRVERACNCAHAPILAPPLRAAKIAQDRMTILAKEEVVWVNVKVENSLRVNVLHCDQQTISNLMRYVELKRSFLTDPRR
jgi:hypothetical protein